MVSIDNNMNQYCGTTNDSSSQAVIYYFKLLFIMNEANLSMI